MEFGEVLFFGMVPLGHGSCDMSRSVARIEIIDDLIDQFSTRTTFYIFKTTTQTTCRLCLQTDETSSGVDTCEFRFHTQR